MKLKTIAATMILSTATAMPTFAAEKVPSTDAEKLSYSLGNLFGTRMKEVYEGLDAKMVVSGINDALSGKKPALDQGEMLELIQKAQREAAMKAQQRMIEAAQKNLEKGEAFLKENGKKSGVVTTESGLQYSIIKEGKGNKPTANSSVTVHYEGRLLDGNVFDSSFKRGEPTTFRVNQVIRGWTEALQLMPEGSTWELYIPSDLAYGPGGAPGGGIGPNETLVFKVELIKVETPEKTDS
ncbi:FKBP-type peptidyl-prolyl cis-trans isomerase [Sansalvadorimonas sp. 2012CJ34-2]|uniref:Peptidyl-prolyl cis-trans isomerase n=1 Tax=Parendozoicomonas callyspongiae TaxID=2942213 RepID=A0ABT0PIH1_9GAMM|nr:FKBP-type peptidyl-prolyl cis-trans isomerase [Sansalvadorimonas sp. 2012CJ34-2]MCL6271182.1 FKBP-type peptidyl-prolyl cis-trans isomerase [Sansalvadorimonas sp. 2012CJ34-2]